MSQHANHDGIRDGSHDGSHDGSRDGSRDDHEPDELMRMSEPPPVPRRTDAAFARAVADDVKRRRAPISLIFGAPALAAAAIGVAIVVALPGGGELALDAGVVAPSIASVEIAWADEGYFALPSLEGSTDEELLRLDRALDEALQQQR